MNEIKVLRCVNANRRSSREASNYWAKVEKNDAMFFFFFFLHIPSINDGNMMTI